MLCTKLSTNGSELAVCVNINRLGNPEVDRGV